MNFWRLWCLLFCGLALFSRTEAVAGEWVFNPAAHLAAGKIKTQGAELRTSRLNLDLRLSHLWASGFLLGGTFALEEGRSGDTDLSSHAIGPTLGYFSGSGFVLLTVYLGAERELEENGVEFQYKLGRGAQLDLGYLFELGEGFRLGPQLTYRSVKYEHLKPGTGPLGPAENTVASLDYYLALVFGL